MGKGRNSQQKHWLMGMSLCPLPILREIGLLFSLKFLTPKAAQ